MTEQKIRTDISVTNDSSKLCFYDCDYKKRMKISAILKVTAEIAGKDYTDKGLGHEFLWENGYVFLLSRISVHINQYPTEPQIVGSSTWECGKKGAMFLRGYDIKVDGDVYVDGESGWIVVNPETRKIIRPASFPWQMPQTMDRPINALPIEKITMENEERAGEYKVQISDLDANGHVYNANYADIAMNFLPIDWYEKDVENFRINFVNEAKLGDTIEIFRELTDTDARIVGKLPDRVCFETEFIYK